VRALSDESAGKIEKRMRTAFDEMRERADRSWEALEKRVADYELELRARLETLGSEAERARSPFETRAEQRRRPDDLQGESGTSE